MMNVFSTSKTPKMSLKGSDADVSVDLGNLEKINKIFMGIFSAFSYTSGPMEDAISKDAWEKPQNKNKMKKLVFDMGLGPASTGTLVQMINRPWSVTKSKLNSFRQLQATLDSETKRFYNKNDPAANTAVAESFDTYVARLLKTTKYDEDRLKVGLMEIFG